MINISKKTIPIFIIIFIFCALLVFLLCFFAIKKPEKNIEEAVMPEETTSNEEKSLDTVDEYVSTPSVVSNINCTTNWGRLMLINPVFAVEEEFISARKNELIDITSTYGIREGLAGNGTPLLDAEAAESLNEMLNAYKNYNPGHEITTRSCFRSQGTNCGRLCYATGTSDHHTGYTCDLIDDVYGENLDTDYYESHPEWQWLHENSYKYGFIDRFVEAWAGGSMLEPVNITEEGTTGLFETWHYRYVGVKAATEIATGKYNNGAYDSLEHYLKATKRLNSLTTSTNSCN